MKIFLRASLVALSATALALGSPTFTRAQHYASGYRWQAWLGCWTAAPADRQQNGAARLVCITPTSDANVVDISAVADGKVISRDRIDASGRTETIDASNCRGTQSAKWSTDGRRVYLRSAVTCEGTPSEMSAILAMTSSGNWLDVRRVAAGEGSDVRVARYRDVGLTTGVPAEITSALNSRGLFLTRDARVATGSPVGPNAIIEASRETDAAVVEAWVMESGQHFAVDARVLSELADAGVSSRVTDAMIRVSNAATVEHTRTVFYSPYGWNGYDGHYGRGSADAWDQGTGRRAVVNVYPPPVYDPWAFEYWPYGYRYGYAPFGYGFPYGRGESFGARYGYGYGYGYGYNYGRRYNHGYPYRNTPGSRHGYYYPPVIVLHNDPADNRVRGRVIKGEGYTQVGRPDEQRPVNDRPRTAVSTEGRSRSGWGSERGAAPSAPSTEPVAQSAPRTAKARP